jgi:uncharacterized protein YidB (DUF937 family)
MADMLGSILGNVLQSALGGGAQRGGGGLNLMNIILGMLQQGGGAGGQNGLQSIIEQVTRAGFGQQAQSWVGSGQNMPISPEQIMEIFGQGQVQQWAQQSGLSPQETAGGLSGILPEVINQMTPQGQMTQGAELDGLLSALQGSLGRLR